MKFKSFTIVSISLLSLGLTVGCANQPQAETENTQTVATKPSSKNTDNKGKNEPKSQTNTNQAQSNRVSFYTENGVAIRGTDPVAYFQQGRPVQGSNQFTHRWMNANWRFSTAANRDLFAKNPEKYAPKYGGFCAWAVSRGYSAPTAPDAWKIVDGKLYLNYDKGVQRSWQRDIPGNIAKGDRNWPNVLKSLNK